jgi:16S rRNA U1498 N3-methylase RsmE
MNQVLLERHGFAPFTFGPRTLRVEVAVPYAPRAFRAP